MARVQFILKARTLPYSGYEADTPHSWEGQPVDPTKPLSSGLFNSARFVADMLRDQLGHEVQLDHAIDNNEIDKLVTGFRPDIVIIEAFWVVPEKFDILHKLHPHITWIVRNHSATPFMANEGVAMDWSLRYMDHPKVIISCNDSRTDEEIKNLVQTYKPDWTEAQVRHRTTYLPNYYPLTYAAHRKTPDPKFFDVACFGAMRPLKNHLIQAVAAIEYANKIGKTLRFHVNGTRVEMHGLPVLHNLRKMFALLPHELVEHVWQPHDEFVALCRTMDIGLQVSYTETFNIVTADLVMNGVPVVTSADVRWVHKLFHADPNDSRDIAEKMETALWSAKHLSWWKPNVAGLKHYDHQSKTVWKQALDDLMHHPVV